MSFVRNFFAPPARSHVPLTTVTSHQEQEYEDNPTESGPSTTGLDPRSMPGPRRANPSNDRQVPQYDEDEEDFNYRAAQRRSGDGSRLYPPSADEQMASVCSTATNTPVPSRAPSPLPFYYSGTSSCDSDSESEPESPLLSRTRRPWQEAERPRWWPFGGRSRSSSVSGSGASGLSAHGTRDPWRRRRRWRDVWWGFRSFKRLVRRLVRHPFFPKTPVTILLALLFLTIFGVSLTFLLIYILNPDKEPLPWQGYCALRPYSAGPPSLSLPTTALLHTHSPFNSTPPPFPPDDFDTMAPAGVFVGVFSMDTAVERRMLVRSTWANHIRSREGAGERDGGVATSRTVVRFILGQPRKDWERRVKLEMEMYNDMVILPIPENMNSGKTHAYFSWAANNSWVPPLYYDNFTRVPEDFTYLNASNASPVLASHDPIPARQDHLHNPSPKPWVKPDFVVKVDDDSFVMLAELEARLRVELHKAPLPPPPPGTDRKQQTLQYSQLQARTAGDEEPHILDYKQIASYFNISLPSYVTRSPLTLATVPAAPQPPPSPDPLVFWGYLVKNRFMAGELYALSYALVEYVAADPVVKTMTRGAEDKQTSKWIRAHPRAEQVRWTSERCWIYDHPRAGTVYSHGFLFPSEAKRIQERVLRGLTHVDELSAEDETTGKEARRTPGLFLGIPMQWTHSTVSKFHVRYSPPLPDLSLDHSVEALVEGSDMSLLHEDGSMTPDLAWKYREGRRKRYEGQRVGGTVVVHFIKKNMWFLEAAAALLHGEDITPLERALQTSREIAPEIIQDETDDGEGDVPPRSHGHEEPADPISAYGGMESEDGVDADDTRSPPDSRIPVTARTMVRRSRRHEQ